jgi:hypothetical protein
MIDIKSYKENGYLLLKGFFDHGEIDRVRDGAKRIFMSQMQRCGLVHSADLSERQFEQGMFDLFGADLQAFTNCGKHAQHLIALHRLSLDDRIVAVLTQLGLQLPNISTRPVMYFNSPGWRRKKSITVSHNTRTGEACRVPWIRWSSGCRWSISTRLWVRWRSFPVAIGAVSSPLIWQTATATSQSRSTLPRFVPIEVEKGDALFFSTFLVHRSGTNVTNSRPVVVSFSV